MLNRLPDHCIQRIVIALGFVLMMDGSAGSDLFRSRKNRVTIYPGCSPTWGYHQTCWKQFPPVAECDTCSTCNSGMAEGIPGMTIPNSQWANGVNVPGSMESLPVPQLQYSPGHSGPASSRYQVQPRRPGQDDRFPTQQNSDSSSQLSAPGNTVPQEASPYSPPAPSLGPANPIPDVPLPAIPGERTQPAIPTPDTSHTQLPVSGARGRQTYSSGFAGPRPSPGSGGFDTLNRPRPVNSVAAPQFRWSGSQHTRPSGRYGGHAPFQQNDRVTTQPPSAQAPSAQLQSAPWQTLNTPSPSLKPISRTVEREAAARLIGHDRSAWIQR